jgi:uncharacterized protein YcbK (DUF882 family)
MMIEAQEKTANFDLPIVSRRKFMSGVAALVGVAALPSNALASIPKFRIGSVRKPARFLAFDNLHTGETIKLTYWEKGRYIKGALSEINHILRDHRTGDVKRIDTALLDKLFLLHNKLGSRNAFQVISGYRSPKSNAMMHGNSSGVAKKSMHMEGRAIDIRLSDVALSHLHNAALALNSGGVGYYPESQFVHIDTGKIRHWGGV